VHEYVSVARSRPFVQGGSIWKFVPSTHSHNCAQYGGILTITESMTAVFCHKIVRAKEHGVQWQLNRSNCLTCTPGRIAAQFNWHGNCATATTDTVVLGKLQAAACVCKSTVELTAFLPCILTNETESFYM